MARRNTSLIEDISDGLQQLPWWIGVIFAGIFWILGGVFGAQKEADTIQQAIRPLVRWFFNFLAIVSLVAAAVSAIRAKSRRRLLDQQRGIESLRALSWQQFEQLVGEAYRRQGYAVQETGGGGADGGVDIVLRRGTETVLVQCKRWRTQRVGVDKVRELFGVVTAENAASGILVTSGRFTNDARSFAANKPITLVDGPALAQLVQDVQTTSAPAVPAPETPTVPEAASPSCPKCGETMVLRTARKGANAGSQFYGCPRFPQCRGTRPKGGAAASGGSMPEGGQNHDV